MILLIRTILYTIWDTNKIINKINSVNKVDHPSAGTVLLARGRDPYIGIRLIVI